MYSPTFHNNLFLFSIILLYVTWLKITVNFDFKIIYWNPDPEKASSLEMVLLI